MDNAFANLKAPHFVRWFALNVCVSLSFFALIVPGIIWTKNILQKTGYRPIDLLLLYLVPIAGPITGIRTQWRYCASEKYWEPAVAPMPVFENIAA